MNSRPRLILGLGLAVLLWPPGAAPCQDAASIAAMEDFLKSARVVSVDKSGMGGRTQPWMVLLSDGTSERKAVFKYVDRRRPALLPDSFRYEIAAYELSKLIGLPIVPPVVERTVEGVPGSLQIYLESCLRFLSALAEIRVFENLVYNECGNLEDTLVHPEDWRICRVDFSEAFAPETGLIPGCRITRCSRTLYDAIRALDRPRIRAALAPLLDEVELDALAARKDRVVAAVEELIRDAGEDAVLFGPPPAKTVR